MKIIKQIVDGDGDNLDFTGENIIVDGKTFSKDDLYVKTGDEKEELPVIYIDPAIGFEGNIVKKEAIIFNHKIDKSRRHITFIHHSSNDKRFLDLDFSNVEWQDLVAYVEYYNKSNDEQETYLRSIRSNFLKDKKTKGLSEKESLKQWVEKGQ